MRDSLAISLTDVTKTYRLYSSVKEQALDVLGVTWLRFWRGPRYTTYPALDGISLEVERGERVGIVGRNGAGKTTLLKLITGNFAPTSGAVHVNGTVQALMQTGLGFHPEFTGHDNVRSALLYNGLSRNEIEAAIEDVINFAELGEFIDQPLKTYSLGMQSRPPFDLTSSSLTRYWEPATRTSARSLPSACRNSPRRAARSYSCPIPCSRFCNSANAPSGSRAAGSSRKVRLSPS
jgi:lipopolysaccharide transport system ATP-binding protein